MAERDTNPLLPNTILANSDPLTLEILLNRDLDSLTPKDMKKHLEILVPKLRAMRKKMEERDNEAHRAGKYGKGPKRNLPDEARVLSDLIGDEG